MKGVKIYSSLVPLYVCLDLKIKRNTEIFQCVPFPAPLQPVQRLLHKCSCNWNVPLCLCVTVSLVTSESTSQSQNISTGSFSIQDTKFLYAFFESVSTQRKVNAEYHAERKVNVPILYSTAGK